MTGYFSHARMQMITLLDLQEGHLPGDGPADGQRVQGPCSRRRIPGTDPAELWAHAIVRDAHRNAFKSSPRSTGGLVHIADHSELNRGLLCGVQIWPSDRQLLPADWHDARRHTGSESPMKYRTYVDGTSRRFEKLKSSGSLPSSGRIHTRSQRYSVLRR
jgi:hypothetical protein